MALSRFAAAALALAAALPAQAVEYNQVLLDKSRIGFVSKQMGVEVDGAFRRFAARVAFDPARPEAGRAEIEIDLASVDAGSEEANEEVRSKNWFHVQQFPKARFVSSAVKALGGNRYEVAGSMTIKGRTRPLSAPFSFKPEGTGGVFEGAFVLKRLDYGIGAGAWSDTGTVADEVQVRFRFVVNAAPGGK